MLAYSWCSVISNHYLHVFPASVWYREVPSEELADHAGGQNESDLWDEVWDRLLDRMEI